MVMGPGVYVTDTERDQDLPVGRVHTNLSGHILISSNILFEVILSTGANKGTITAKDK